MVSRVLMVIAAAFFVISFTIATFVPPDMPLGQFLLLHDRASIEHLRGALASWPAFVWVDLVVPLLVRPAWLAPLMIGIVASGLAINVHSPQPPQRRPWTR